MFALGSWAALAPQTDFAIGTPEYPDRSATLIVEVDALTTESARLTGPGIESEAHLSLPETGFRPQRRAISAGRGLPVHLWQQSCRAAPLDPRGGSLMYVAVKGGERAIDNAHAWLAEERRATPPLPSLARTRSANR